MGQRGSHFEHDSFNNVERRNTSIPYNSDESKRLSTMSLNRRRSLKMFRNSYSIDLNGTFRRKSSNEDEGTFSFKIPEDERVNINTSSEEQLMTLPGVHRSVAKAIVERREVIGKFEAVDDLAKVPGIDKKILKSISSEVSTGEGVEGSAGEPEKKSPSAHASVDSVFEAVNSKPNKIF